MQKQTFKIYDSDFELNFKHSNLLKPHLLHHNNNHLTQIRELTVLAFAGITQFNVLANHFLEAVR